jgi:hypothetical protein
MTLQQRQRRHVPGVWWISPQGAALLVLPLTLGFAAGYSAEDFQTYFRTPKSLTTGTSVLFAVGGLLFVLGALAAQVGRDRNRLGAWPWLDRRQLLVLRRVSTVLFRVTLIGYASFVVAAGARGVSPADVVRAIVGQDVSSGELEATIGTVPGVTTLTQVGVAYAVVAALLLVHGRDRRTMWRLAVLGVLTLTRAYVFTERLALIEVAVPAMVVLVLRASQSASPGRRWMLRIAPIPLIAMLVVGFAASEYSRSYTFFKTRTDDSLLVFASKRLTGYYATAYNNGQLLIDHDRYPGRLPYTTVEALWTAPGVEQLGLYDRLVGRDRAAQYNSILDTYGSREFNNPGGLAAPFVDFGTAGGLLTLLALGALTGAAYRACVQGSVVAVLLYPVAVTGLLEMPRFLYWTLGRTVPTVLALLVVAVLVHRAGRLRHAVAS